MENGKWKMVDGRWKLSFLLFTLIFSLGVSHAQFTTHTDTLLILTGDSTTVIGWEYDSTADTTSGTPYTGYTGGIDLNGKVLVGVDFDTTSAFTAAKFGIQTSATYNDDADTVGGTPYDWKTVNFDGDTVTFTPEVGGINHLNRDKVFALKRYVRFICLSAVNAWANEAAPRKLIALLRSGF